MGHALSKEEYDALLGGNGALLPLNTVQPPNSALLDEAARALARSLQSLTGEAVAWSAAEPVVVAAEQLGAALGMPAGAILLVTAVMLPKGALYMATNTLTACRIDEAAQSSLGAISSEAFANWRQLSGRLAEEFARIMSPKHLTGTSLLCAQPARRWDPTQGGGVLGIADGENVLVLPFHSPDTALGDVFFLMPESACIGLTDKPIASFAAPPSAAAQPAEEAHEETPAPQDDSSMHMQVVADIPLNIAIAVEIGRLPVRAVAAWRNGSLTPVNLLAGQPVELKVNDHTLAKGRLVSGADGTFAVQLVSVLPLEASQAKGQAGFDGSPLRMG